MHECTHAAQRGFALSSKQNGETSKNSPRIETYSLSRINHGTSKTHYYNKTRY